ncbi:hypothetical protein Leryth_008419 [Lithospermum erythrorhizon]|uniref:AP2/ERF domain-containing protein n=1 Tax=Lithospermum erythrorhizon TaxID=34254 RepID=A0AAV3RAD9_LITER|nr:hypothetical protein Leryth_008419 [Lithospermum erythrorhizon]
MNDFGDQYTNWDSSILEEEVQLACNTPKKRAGRKKFCETRHPIYRGVRKRNSGKWVCEMREPNKKSRIWLGTFPTVEMAARAHDVAAIALRGKSACLNFADSAWRLPIPASLDTKDIQKAAAEAAEAFRPMTMEVDQVGPSEYANVVEEDVLTPEEWMVSTEDDGFFMDEDESMPRLITSMAEGLMLPPPPVHQSIDEEDQEHHLDLWSF